MAYEPAGGWHRAWFELGDWGRGVVNEVAWEDSPGRVCLIYARGGVWASVEAVA